MEREELRQLIRQGIKNAVIKKASNAEDTISVKKTDSYLNSEELTEDDIDSALFYGGGKAKKDSDRRTFTIKENMDNNIKITTSEIKKFEQSFKEVLDALPGSTIVFHKQKNGYSLLAIKKPDGIEAVSSGIINLGSSGKIAWAYSILNGLTMNAQNLKLSNSNKIATEILFNHYDSWQKEWREKLNYPQIGTQEPM